MKKIFAILFSCLLVASLAFGLVACGDKEKEKEKEAYTVTDQYNRTVTFNKVPDYIISLVPSNTEIVFALGQGAKLIGRTDYCNYPAAVADVDIVSGYWSLNLEMIMAKVGNNKDSTVILAEVSQADYVDSLADLGYKVIILDAENLEDVFRSMEVFNKVMGGKISGYDTYIQGLRNRVNAITSQITSSTPKISAVGVIGTGFWVAGSDTFVGDLINIAGGINVAAGGYHYYDVSAESFIAFNPTVIIYTTDMGSDYGVYDALTSAPYNNMFAVINGQLYTIESDFLFRPGPRLIDALEAFAQILHPEIFGAYTA